MGLVDENDRICILEMKYVFLLSSRKKFVNAFNFDYDVIYLTKCFLLLL